MLNRVITRVALVAVLAVCAVTVPACQSTKKAEPEMLTGATDVTHERHDSGIDSHTAD